MLNATKHVHATVWDYNYYNPKQKTHHEDFHEYRIHLKNRGTSSRSRFRGLPQHATVCRDYNNGKRNGEMGWSWISWIVTQKLTNNSEETKLLNCDSTWEQPLEAKEKLTKTKTNWSSPWSREAKVVSTWNLSKTDEPWTFFWETWRNTELDGSCLELGVLTCV